jgi:rhodanese-related sulfurtransferase
VSFANCGLPYYVGDVIRDEAKLLVASAELFRERFGIEVHTEHDVTGIDRAARTITVRALRSGESRIYPYDALVLSPGAAPVRPPIPGVDLDGVFSLRTIPDSRRFQIGDMPLAQQSTIDEIQARAAPEAAAAAPSADAAARPLVLDVREPGECEAGMLPDALNIPLNQLRGRLAELPRDRMIVVYCAVGQRGYYAVRMLRQNGFDARNFSGGYQTYAAMREARLVK